MSCLQAHKVHKKERGCKKIRATYTEETGTKSVKGPYLLSVDFLHFLEKYSQLPLLRTPSGPQVSVLNMRVRPSGNLFQTNVCKLFFAGDLVVSVLPGCL